MLASCLVSTMQGWRVTSECLKNSIPFSFFVHVDVGVVLNLSTRSHAVHGAGAAERGFEIPSCFSRPSSVPQSPANILS